MRKCFARFCTLAIIAAPALFQSSLQAQTPVANAVPFVASNPTSPHTSWSGNSVTLKGTLTSSAFGTHTFTYDWNPGDGGAHCTGTVTNQYVISCAHTYTGSVGTVYTAVLTITDTTNHLVSPAVNCPPATTQGACYYTSLNSPPPNLAIEVNNAIDNGLWYLHSQMRRYTTTGGAPAGDWFLNNGSNVDAAYAGDTGPSSLECSAFENSGFLQNNNPANPYSLDVQLCLNGIFDQLSTLSISTVNAGPPGTYNPDSNGNGIGVQASAPYSGYTNYQTGMMLDAIVASGTPSVPLPTGTALATAIKNLGLSGTGTGGAYSYGDAVIDMVDDYAYCAAPYNSSFGYVAGGWHYTCQDDTGDNSVSQWAAIGIIPGIRKFGATISPIVHTTDENWLDSSFTNQNPSTGYNGYFGYTSNTPLWGPYADTPSGLVQLAMSGLGRGKVSPAGNHLWDAAETFIRDNFGTPQSAGPGSGAGVSGSLKDYYYGMFSFTKAMLLHDNNDGTGALGSGNQPIQFLISTDDPNTCSSPVPLASPGSGTGPCYPKIDWYAAQTSAYGGTDPTNGVARTILSNQNADGSWFGQNYTSAQNYFETGIAITMLNKTVVNPVPVACFTITPAQVVNGASAVLNGSCSIDQNPANTLISWAWDVSGDGGSNFTIAPGTALAKQYCLTTSCSSIKYPFTLPNGKSYPYSFLVSLQVTDSGGLLSAPFVSPVIIAQPPLPPQANAGGPYNFCPNTSSTGALIYAPWTLNGGNSIDPDAGQEGPGGTAPSALVSWLWDLSGQNNFSANNPNLVSGVQINVAVAPPSGFLNDAPNTFRVSLQVTNNDSVAFPTSPLGNQSNPTSAQVTIHSANDNECTHCVNTLGGKSKAPAPGVPGNIQLYWTDTNTAWTSATVNPFPIDHYNIYRATTSANGPFTQIAGAASSPFLPAIQAQGYPGGGTLYFLDSTVVGGTTYYYRVAPATINDTETCQGNVTLTVAVSKGR